MLAPPTVDASKGTAKLQLLIRESSAVMLEAFAGRVARIDVASQALGPQPPPPAERRWTSVILLTDVQLTIQFTVHFARQSAAEVAAQMLRRPVAALGPDAPLDFMREFCNLTAGGIKKGLQTFSHGRTETALGIPQVVPALAHLPPPPDASVIASVDDWLLHTAAGHAFLCTSRIRAHQEFDFRALEKMNVAQILTVNDDSHIELF